MANMETTQDQPLYIGGPKSKRNNGLIFSLLITLAGVYFAITSGSATLMLIVGLGGASYSWFSVATRFLIYQNVLVIKYGWPKVKVVPLPEISLMEKVEQATGEQLRLRLTNGKQVMIAAADIDEFQARLEEARKRFTGVYVEPAAADPGVGQEPQGPAPY
jgi:hypothetical protein